MIQYYLFHGSVVFYVSCDRNSGRCPQKKRPRSEVALYCTTRPKRLSPHFESHAQPPWKVLTQRAFQYENISTTGCRCCLLRVEIQFESKLMKLWNLIFDLPSAAAASSSPPNASYKWFLKIFPYFYRLQICYISSLQHFLAVVFQRYSIL